MPRHSPATLSSGRETPGPYQTTLTNQVTSQPSTPSPTPPVSLCLVQCYSIHLVLSLRKLLSTPQNPAQGSDKSHEFHSLWTKQFAQRGLLEPLGCFPLVCRHAVTSLIYTALGVQRQEAHPGSRAAAAESRNRWDFLLIPRSPFSLRVPS